MHCLFGNLAQHHTPHVILTRASRAIRLDRQSERTQTSRNFDCRLYFLERADPVWGVAQGLLQTLVATRQCVRVRGLVKSTDRTSQKFPDLQGFKTPACGWRVQRQPSDAPVPLEATVGTHGGPRTHGGKFFLHSFGRRDIHGS